MLELTKHKYCYQGSYDARTIEVLQNIRQGFENLAYIHAHSSIPVQMHIKHLNNLESFHSYIDDSPGNLPGNSIWSFLSVLSDLDVAHIRKLNRDGLLVKWLSMTLNQIMCIQLEIQQLKSIFYEGRTPTLEQCKLLYDFNNQLGCTKNFLKTVLDNIVILEKTNAPIPPEKFFETDKPLIYNFDYLLESRSGFGRPRDCLKQYIEELKIILSYRELFYDTF